MRKRLLSLLLTLAMLACLAPALAADEISGVYEGYYFAQQGQTGVTLTVTGDTAKFEFYNLPGRSNAASGSFWMSVRQENGIYYFDAGEWIEKPSTYETVDLELTLSDNVLSGEVKTNWGGPFTFYAERPNEAYAQIQESIFDGHRYSVVSQGMTWQEASDYCAQQGGYLATVTSQEELAFLQGLTAGRGACWLGGQGDGYDWTWSNGEPWTFGAPPTQGGYLKLESDGSWTAGSANERLSAFVCEWGTWSEASNWSSTELEKAYEAGLIPDVLIGADMTGRITRGEFAAVVVKLYEALSGGRAIIAADCPFTDIAQDTNRLYILKAYNLDLVNGVGGNKYDPSASLTREQMATMLCRAYKLYQWPDWNLENDGNYPLDISGVSIFADDGDISDFARQSVYFMVKSNIIQGVGNNCFAPKNTTTQQEAAGYANATREQALALSLRSLETLK